MRKQPRKLAIMKSDARLLGTKLILKKGQMVVLQKATNIPTQDRFYARPARVLRDELPLWGKDNSILLGSAEFDFVKEG